MLQSLHRLLTVCRISISDHILHQKERAGHSCRFISGEMTTALEGNPHRRSSLELPNLLSLSKQKSRVLGSGAYGVVKSVRLKADQGLVAVKTLRAHASTSEMECFAREKEILRNLDHKCAVYAHLCLHAVHALSAVSA